MSRHLSGPFWRISPLLMALTMSLEVGSAYANPCTDQAPVNTLSALTDGKISTEPEGLGGTGVKVAGGDGKQNDGPEGLGGTGIAGMITGFGSICVNGIEVHYSSTTPVDVSGLPASSSALKIGQRVVIEALGLGPEVVAKKVSVEPVLVGKVDAVAKDGASLTLLGQTVVVAGKTNVAPGMTLRVSGYWGPDGVVYASLLEPVADTVAQVTGPVSVVKGLVQVGNVPVQGLQGAKSGATMTVHGNWSGSTLQAAGQRESVSAQLLAQKGIVRFELQGLTQVKDRQVFNLAGQMVRTTSNTRFVGEDTVKTSDIQQVRVSGVLKEGRFVAETVRVEGHASPFKGQGTRGGKSAAWLSDDGQSRSGEGGSDDGGHSSSSGSSGDSKESGSTESHSSDGGSKGSGSSGGSSGGGSHGSDD